MRASIRFVIDSASSAEWGTLSGVVMALLSARHLSAVNLAADELLLIEEPRLTETPRVGM
jgi:hypothetical protein